MLSGTPSDRKTKVGWIEYWSVFEIIHAVGDITV